MKTTEHMIGHQSLPDELLQILPKSLLGAISRLGLPRAEEIRLHAGRICTVSCGSQNYQTGIVIDEKQLHEILFRLCSGSLYAYAQNINDGYLTPVGGIRVGVCGKANVENGRVIGVSSVSGLIIRIPHDVSIDPSPILDLLRVRNTVGGILIYAPPGVGKTSLLRAVARGAASREYGLRTVVVDTREELKYGLEGASLTLDILEGYPRAVGIEIAARSLGAQLIICDEIGSSDDAKAILNTANSGIPLIASAHAATFSELLRRPAISELHRAGIFHTYVGLSRNENGFSYTFSTRDDADRDKL